MDVGSTYCPVSSDPKTYVGTGSQPGIAHVADELLLNDSVSRLQSRHKTRQVGVVGHVTLGVADLQQVPETARGAAVDHLAVGDRQQGRTDGRGIVDAVMGSGDIENRMKSRGGEARTDASETQRGHQELTLDRCSIGPVVAPRRLLRLRSKERRACPRLRRIAPRGSVPASRKQSLPRRRYGADARTRVGTRRPHGRCARSRCPRRIFLKNPRREWDLHRVPRMRRGGSL